MSRYKTPLRYPGGKQKLAPFIAELVDANNLVGGDYAEPYAGGAGVAVDLLLSGKVARIHLNDSHKAVYYFWRSILEETETFCRKIASASLTVPEWRRQKQILTHRKDFSPLDVGFAMFFLNRCNRSGIGSGGVIGGLDQTGEWKMDARFPRNELIQRIESIARFRTKIQVRNMDAERFIMQYVPRLPAKTLVYCDPPYYQKAERLYPNYYQPNDHSRIAELFQSGISHKWVVSYDGVPEILKLYKSRRYFLYSLQYNAAKAYRGTEVFVFSDDLVLPKVSSLTFIETALHRARQGSLRKRRASSRL